MQQEYFGVGSITQLGPILAKEKLQRIFLVRGRDSYHSSGLEEKMGALLKRYEVVQFSYSSPDPKIEDIKKGKELFQQSKCDYTIAAGGGSALDLGKAITLLASQEEKAEDCIKQKVTLRPREYPLIAIPTTAGTGSEATHFATIYISKTKYSLAHPSLIPDHAIIDPALTYALPPYQTACTGMDVLAQAVESYWSVHATFESKQYAKEAIYLSLKNLEKAVSNPAHQEARSAMMKSANLAGKAINISFTTACHAISYPITAHFGVPHGHAVALTLPEIALYNAKVAEEDCLDARGKSYVQNVLQELCHLFEVASPDDLKKKIERLMDGIGLERGLSGLGISTAKDREIILQQGFNPERVKNNPRRLREEDLREILEKIS